MQHCIPNIANALICRSHTLNNTKSSEELQALTCTVTCTAAEFITLQIIHVSAAQVVSAPLFESQHNTTCYGWFIALFVLWCFSAAGMFCWLHRHFVVNVLEKKYEVPQSSTLILQCYPTYLKENTPETASKSRNLILFQFKTFWGITEKFKHKFVASAEKLLLASTNTLSQTSLQQVWTPMMLHKLLYAAGWSTHSPFWICCQCECRVSDSLSQVQVCEQGL